MEHNLGGVVLVIFYFSIKPLLVGGFWFHSMTEYKVSANDVVNNLIWEIKANPRGPFYF